MSVKSRPQRLKMCSSAEAMSEGPFSCDSVVVLEDSVEGGGAILFAKNSDRPAADCSVLVTTRSEDHAPGALVDVGYGTLPQVEHTYATLGIALYWNWGYEQGLNCRGVVGGVQAAATKCHAAAVRQILACDTPKIDPCSAAVSVHPVSSLCSCDLLRLGLERASTAREAVEVIASLLEQHGQVRTRHRRVHTDLFP
jgi:secernin